MTEVEQMQFKNKYTEQQCFKLTYHYHQANGLPCCVPYNGHFNTVKCGISNIQAFSHKHFGICCEQAGTVDTNNACTVLYQRQNRISSSKNIIIFRLSFQQYYY